MRRSPCITYSTSFENKLPYAVKYAVQIFTTHIPTLTVHVREAPYKIRYDHNEHDSEHNPRGFFVHWKLGEENVKGLTRVYCIIISGFVKGQYNTKNPLFLGDFWL